MHDRRLKKAPISNWSDDVARRRRASRFLLEGARGLVTEALVVVGFAAFAVIVALVVAWLR